GGGGGGTSPLSGIASMVFGGSGGGSVLELGGGGFGFVLTGGGGGSGATAGCPASGLTSPGYGTTMTRGSSDCARACGEPHSAATAATAASVRIGVNRSYLTSVL